ncbi:centrosomal protein of 290 kDa-like [Pollicipes pollicipes]|uniref:centrosomal protein of 290 kDa-like n=1 Tax=Pollicipes pollicipes TaxID=41117 RepID=UPI0018855BBE|nr:centrosomal protein of 290 kDa-like [Pollicipes pollicipes]
MTLVASLQAESSVREPPASGGQLSGSQLSRLHESGELLAEQERAIGALMERLRQSREEEARYRERVTRLESERRDTADVLQRTVSSLTEERSRLRDQLAQAATQAGLVDRLREIMLKKERQHHTLARVLRDIKAEIVQTVEAAALQWEEECKQEPAGEQPPTARSRTGTDRLHSQLATAERELDTVKNELNDRTLQCHRLQADLHEADRRRREEVQRLQRQLEAIQEELAKWDERKRWQRTTERLRARLREKEAECERQQALAAGLRDTIHRLEREKTGYEAKIRTLSGLMSEERFHALERENVTLKEQLSQLRGSESVERGAQLEQLRQQVHTLTSRLAAQRAAAKQGKRLRADNLRLRRELLRHTVTSTTEQQVSRQLVRHTVTSTSEQQLLRTNGFHAPRHSPFKRDSD